MTSRYRVSVAGLPYYGVVGEEVGEFSTREYVYLRFPDTHQATYHRANLESVKDDDFEKQVELAVNQVTLKNETITRNVLVGATLELTKAQIQALRVLLDGEVDESFNSALLGLRDELDNLDLT